MSPVMAPEARMARSVAAMSDGETMTRRSIAPVRHRSSSPPTAPARTTSLIHPARVMARPFPEKARLRPADGGARRSLLHGLQVARQERGVDHLAEIDI